MEKREKCVRGEYEAVSGATYGGGGRSSTSPGVQVPLEVYHWLNRSQHQGAEDVG